MITLTHSEKKKKKNNPFNIVKKCATAAVRECVCLCLCANNRKKYPDEVASKRRVVGSSE